MILSPGGFEETPTDKFHVHIPLNVPKKFLSNYYQLISLNIFIKILKSKKDLEKMRIFFLNPIFYTHFIVYKKECIMLKKIKKFTFLGSQFFLFIL